MASSDFDLGLEDLEIPLSPSPPRAVHNRNKRRRPNNDSTDGDGEDNSRAMHPGAVNVVNGNVIAAARRLGTAKRFRPEQMSDLEAFLSDSAFGREARSYIQGSEILAKLDKIITNKPTWEVSKALKENIKHYVAAASLSTSLISFRSQKTAKLICDKLLDLGLDLPDNIRQDVSCLEKLKKAIEEELTQRRGSMKKEIRLSISKNMGNNRWEHLPNDECQNIYELAWALVKNTRCSVTPELCARIAILRLAFEKNSGKNFWMQVDATIEELRRKGEGNKKTTARYVKAVLEQDRKKYPNGLTGDLSTEEVQSDLQTEMDQLIEASQLSGKDGDEEVDDAEDGAGERDKGKENEPVDQSSSPTAQPTAEPDEDDEQ